MHLAAPQRDVLALGHARAVAGDGVAQGLRERLAAARVRPVAAVVDGHVVFIRQIARQVRRGKRAQLGIVKRLDGVHVVVRHLGGCVDRDLLKRERPGAHHVVVPRLGDLIVAGLEHVRVAGAVAGRALRAAVKQPERDVHALDLLDVVGGRERARQEGLALVVRAQRLHGVVLAQAKREDIVRPQRARKLPRHDRRVAAVGAGRGRGALVADELRAARRAAVDAQAVRLRAPVAAEVGGVPAAGGRGGFRSLGLGSLRCFGLRVGRLLGCGGLGLLAGIERLDLGHVE